MRPIRAVLIDDEALARIYLRELLAAHPEVEILAECENGFEAVKAVAQHGPDLLFLDIQMPKLDGFEVLELIEPGPQVIFVTAYDQYALKAFEVHAVDYLLKPFTPERLAEALARVGEPSSPAPRADRLAADARPAGRYLSRIAIRDGAAVHVIPVDEIDYVQAQDDYIEIHSGDRSYLKHQTLQSLADGLDPAGFVRIHRSSLVNLERIARIEPWTKDTKLVIMADQTQLTASRAGYKRLQAAMEPGD